MGNVIRGWDGPATFKASATLTTKYQCCYISASATVAPVNTTTNIAIGTIADKSVGGAGTAVQVNLFWPTHRAIAYAAVTAGSKVKLNASGGYEDATTGTTVAGIAVTGAATAGQTFELFPLSVNTAIS